jgi:hypothetical protein
MIETAGDYFVKTEIDSRISCSPPDFDLFPKLKKPLRGKRFRSIEEVSNEVT